MPWGPGARPRGNGVPPQASTEPSGLTGVMGVGVQGLTEAPWLNLDTPAATNGWWARNGTLPPADGPDTYVRRMLVDLSERGRYLGLVLFSAQQFRSQVLRRVVGNAGTTIFGRMDPDELATPGYAPLSPAIKTRLATLSKGELMLRHPHFTQPVFVRFPRPAVLGGREGVERFPPAPDLSFPDAVARQLRSLDRGIAADAVRDLIAGRREDDVRRALSATRRERPADVEAYFRACLGRRVGAEVIAGRRGTPALRRGDDPYAP